jgi:hypothetical protein
MCNRHAPRFACDVAVRSSPLASRSPGMRVNSFARSASARRCRSPFSTSYQTPRAREFAVSATSGSSLPMVNRFVCVRDDTVCVCLGLGSFDVLLFVCDRLFLTIFTRGVRRRRRTAGRKSRRSWRSCRLARVASWRQGRISSRTGRNAGRRSGQPSRTVLIFVLFVPGVFVNEVISAAKKSKIRQRWWCIGKVYSTVASQRRHILCIRKTQGDSVSYVVVDIGNISKTRAHRVCVPVQLPSCKKFAPVLRFVSLCHRTIICHFSCSCLAFK